MERLLRSKAFWTALISTIAVLVMRYTSIPEEVWQSFAALFGTIVIIFTGEEIERGISLTMERAVGEISRLAKK